MKDAEILSIFQESHFDPPLLGGLALATPPLSGDDLVVQDHQVFAGTHLLLDLWECDLLDELALIERVLVQAATDAGATVLNTSFHRFSPSGGVSGVLLLAESHISIHTWPERRYAAIDVFMCGRCNPHGAVPAIKAGFKPVKMEISAHLRGRL